MAVVDLTDIYNPLLWANEIQEKSTTLNRFVASGVLVTTPLYDAIAMQSGNIAELPFYAPLTRDEPNISSDDPAVNSTPANISSKKQIARSQFLNKSWSTMDLAVEIASKDPTEAITDSIGGYWSTDHEQRVIQSLKGVIADNKANDSGDMVNTIASESIAGQSATTRIGGSQTIDTLQTAGDQGNYDTIAMHSVQYRELQKQELIDYIPTGQANITIPTYLGMKVVFDDSMPVRAGTTDGFVYTVALFRTGAFALGTGAPEKPSELERKPSAGNGGGQDIIYSRQTKIIHPQGFQFTSASVAGDSPTYAELALAANWDRVKDRKNIGIAILECN